MMLYYCTFDVYHSRPAITKHLLAKYPDLDSERSRTYLRTAFRTGLASEALVLARKEGRKFKMFWF